MSSQPDLSDLRGTLEHIQSGLRSLPLDPAALAERGLELTALGVEVSASIEAEFLALVEPNAA